MQNPGGVAKKLSTGKGATFLRALLSWENIFPWLWIFTPMPVEFYRAATFPKGMMSFLALWQYYYLSPMQAAAQA
ncbi:MAG: hypothetical protein Q4A82_04460 [Corynebacterium sp.]|nr:hypothetical protein [Corynebacterium sp.]